MSNFLQRTLSGAVYAAVVIASITLHPVAAIVLFLAITVLAVREYHVLMKSPRWVMGWSIAVGVCLFMSHTDSYELFWHLLTVVGLMAALMNELFMKAENPMRNWGNILVSLAMLALPFATAADILNMGQWDVQRYVLLSVFVCIWSNDSGAYCVGSLIGKHKMFPRVSPGKSWEGLVGGFLFSLLAGYLFSLFVTEYALWQWLLIALCCSTFGTFGDLMESLLKRTIGVKDSGRFLPGHGGVLDRFDSILFAAPAVWVLLKIFMLIG